MSFTIYKMEMRRNLKSFIIWGFSLAAILFLGMLFYPAISEEGLLPQMSVMFENPMMSGMMKAFGVVDIYSLGSLQGFYVTYNSIYNILLGCIFAAVLAGNLLAKEEAQKTAEFLFTRPVTRNTLFWSKCAVMGTYLLLISVVFFLVSILAMETVKGDSPRELDLSKRQKNILIEAIRSRPEVIYKAFDLDEKSFDDLAFSFASDLLSSNIKELDRMDLRPEDMNLLIKEASQSPADFFARVEVEPERYMKMFQIPESGKNEFLENIRKERTEYLQMKKSFFESPDVFIMFLDENPRLILSSYAKEKGSMKKALELLGLDPRFENKIFHQYSVAKMAQISVYFFFLLCVVGTLVVILSLLIKRGKSNTGLALGMVFFFYFVNSLHGIAKNFPSLLGKLGYISPFTWIDTDVQRPGFVLDWWRLALFFGVSLVALVVGNRLLNRKDILV